MDFHLILMTIVAMVSKCTCATLLEEHLKKTGYEKNDIPNEKEESKVNITVQLFLYSIGPIEEADFLLETAFYLRQWWVDYRLQDAKNSTVKTTSLEYLIWIPDTSIQYTHTEQFYDNGVRTVIKPDGLIYMVKRMETKTKCEMDLKNYPMDSQTCTLTIETFAYDTHDIELYWHSKPIITPDTPLTLDGYELVKIESETVIHPYVVGNETQIFKTLVVKFTIKRSFLFNVYRAYVPSILMLAFAFGTFWVPDTAIPARMGMIVTSFLSSIFILQSVSENTVKVPYTTAMQLFLVINVALIATSLLQYLVILWARKQERIRYEKKLNLIFENESVQREFTGIASKNKEVRGVKKQNSMYKDVENEDETGKVNIGETHIIDLASRIVIPLSYAIFCAVYFTYYLH